LITGATRGIGLGIAKQLSMEGFALTVSGTRSEQDNLEVLDALRANGNTVVYIQGNIGNTEDRILLVEKTMQKYGRIDVLVNNAGVAPLERKDLLEMTEESMDRLLTINLKGTFFLSQIVAKEMIHLVESGLKFNPCIITISSVSSFAVSTSRGEYCISKAGLSMVTQLFAARLAEYGICVHEVRPGVIRTDMTAGVSGKYDKLISEGLSPIKRWGTPEDVASAVSRLASGRLHFSTGEILNVDGGFHIHQL